MSENRTIVIDNQAAINHLEICVPVGGGITVLQGRNGKGKSHALAACQTLINGGGKLVVADGADQASVSGLGVRVTLRKRQSRDGNLECVSLESDLDLSKLVDPGIADPVSADAARQRVIIALAQAQRSANEIAKELGCDESFVLLMPDKQVDMLTAADHVKKALQSEALRDEKLALAAEKSVAIKRAALESLPESLSGRSEAEIRADMPTLNAKLAACQSAVMESVHAAKRVADAEQEFESSEVGAEETPDEIQQQIAGLYDAERSLDGDIKRLESELAELKGARDLLVADRELAEKRLRLAEQIHSRNESLAADRLAAADLESRQKRQKDAEAEVNALFDELNAAGNAAKRAEAKRELDGVIDSRDGFTESAKKLREQAAAVRKLLGSVIGTLNPNLLVDEEGLLRFKTDRGDELFSELSAGEKWTAAIAIGAAAVGSRGLLVIEQEGFEGIDPQTREKLSAMAKSAGVNIVTAEAGPQEEIKVVQL